MKAYALGVTLLAHFLQEFIMITKGVSKEAELANYFTVAGKVDETK